MKKQDNRGFSLIELLVAVVIMAVVIVPLLRGFLSSYRVNNKSRNVLRATTLAQNEMEIFEKEKLEDLTDSAKFSYTWSADDTTGIYTFERLGVSMDAASSVGYDVYVKLNPKRQVGEVYETQNSSLLLNMNTVSALDSGTYIQPMKTKTNAVGQDEAVYGIFNMNKTGIGGAGWNVERFAKELKRDIYLEVTKSGEDEDAVTRAKVIYEYICTSDGVMKDGYKNYKTETVVFDNSSMFDEDGKRVELKSLYLFYAPRYGLAPITNTDTIHIHNLQGLPVNFYIVRQELLGDTGSDVEPAPFTYQAKLEIKDALAGGKAKGLYWTNLNLGGIAAEGEGAPLKLSFTDLDDPVRVYSESESLTVSGIKSLGVSEAKDRIYVMEVEVYAQGDSPGTDRPLAKLEGTKLE